jgi:hypothetical protein
MAVSNTLAYYDTAKYAHKKFYGTGHSGACAAKLFTGVNTAGVLLASVLVIASHFHASLIFAGKEWSLISK